MERHLLISFAVFTITIVFLLRDVEGADFYRGWNTKGGYTKLFSAKVTKSAIPFWVVRDTLTYKIDKPGIKEIKQIIALDHMPKGEGGYVTIKKGGLYGNHVTLGFTSQLNKGLRYSVSIYGQ